MVIVDKNVDFIVEGRLSERYGPIIKSYPLTTIPAPVNTHPDMQIHFISDFLAVCAPECFEYYQKILPKNITVKQGTKHPSGTYPGDIAYNVSRIGNTVFCKTENTEPTILSEYRRLGFRIVNVKQGYAKCNTCLISDNAVITEDKGLHKIFMSTRVDSCLIQPGEVDLPGFPYGFLGGASGLIGQELVISGCITKHPQFRQISVFLDKYHRSYFELSDRKMIDLGSIVNIKE